MSKGAVRTGPRLVGLSALAVTVAAASLLYSTDWLRAPSFRALFNLAPHCTIKGEVNYITRERVYHLPGQFYYPRVGVSLPRGERWFCSEAEAKRAGWRRSRH